MKETEQSVVVTHFTSFNFSSLFLFMLRFKTISSLLFFAAAVLVFFVFTLHFFIPSYHQNDQINPQLNKNFPFLPHRWVQPESTTTIFIPAEPIRDVIPPSIPCREHLITIEQFRSRSIVRAVFVRFPSKQSDYYFVQFRWFYRSWIESEMFTLDRWRTDLIVLIDDEFPKETRGLLEHLDCHVENQRKSRRQISRCILVEHKRFSQRTQSQQDFYREKYSKLKEIQEFDENIDRLFAIYDHIQQLNQTQMLKYDFLMITTMNTFLTTQFGKYIPLKCAFLLGIPPDYTTWYAKSNQIVLFLDTLLLTLNRTNDKLLIDFSTTTDKLKSSLTFYQNQVDIPCDSKKTTYRTSIYHIKCYADSTSLFSEKMFRDGAYDGFDKEPFNIYIAREYAALMALQSKTLSLDDLHLLAVNITRREIFT